MIYDIYKEYFNLLSINLSIYIKYSFNYTKNKFLMAYYSDAAAKNRPAV